MGINKNRKDIIAGLMYVIAGFCTIALANPELVPGVWKNISPQGSSGDVWMLKVSINNPDYIYVGTGGSGLYVSTDGGSTYRSSDVADYIAGIEIDPNDAAHLYVGGWQNGDFWESTDAGVTWTKRPLIGSPDIGEITTDPSDFKHILVSWHYIFDNQGTICESTDGGLTWKAIFIPGVQGASSKGVHFLNQPGLNIGDRNTWLVTTEGGGYYRTSDAGATWITVSTVKGLHGGLKGVYYTKAGVLYTGGNPCPVRSTDNGQTWEEICGNLGNWYYHHLIGDGKTLYLGVGYPSTPIYTSPESDGKTWTAGPILTQGSGTTPFAFDTLNHIVYVASGPSAYALKVADQATAIDLTKPLKRNMASSGMRVISAGMMKPGPHSQGVAYDIRGKSISRKNIGNQMVMIRSW